MRIQICFLIILLFVFSSISAAQIVSNDEDFETVETLQAKKFLEFGLTGECEIGAIIDAIFIEMNNRPTLQAYIIVYRGAEDLPSYQSNEFVQRQFGWMRRPMAFRRYDSTKITLIDGGFRKSDKFSAEVWLVPTGGIVPRPTETVQKPELPKDKAYLVVKKFNDIVSLAYFTQQDYENLEEIEEIEQTQEVEQDEEVEEIEAENFKDDWEQIIEYNELYWSFSSYFIKVLRNDSALRGTIIYYADGEQYDLGKAQKLMTEFLQTYKEKFDMDLSRVNLVYGGYREQTEIEYWIVPKGAKEPQPKPEVKKVVEKTEEN